jgi:hypothetical protein
MKTRMFWSMLLTVALLAVGCGEAVDDENAESRDGVDASVFEGGKSDMGSRAELIDNIALDSKIEGEFDPRIRAYGYSFEAKSGAELSASLQAFAGPEAHRLDEGDELDTVLAVYHYDEDRVGDLIVKSGDSAGDPAAPPVSFEVESDGKFLLAFFSYDDTGAGKYTVSLECAGTDLQCRRPDFEKPCEDGELYIQGGKIDEDATWETCDVILLEPTVVAEDATLTIKPGVTVKGNFLSESGNHFGDVTLRVEGLLQAVGTEEHPIAFTALTERGWGGIVIDSLSNSFEHIFIEKANVAISVRTNGSASIDQSVIEGGLTIGSGDDAETVQSQTGIHSQGDAEAYFTRALVKGFENGVLAEDSELLVIEDSVIRDNVWGVRVVGQDANTRCRDRAPTVNVYRDPKIVHSDIFDNEHGIRVDGSDVFVQVEKSNIINNGGYALEIRGAGLHDDSYLRENNIFGNRGATGDDNTAQVRTFHRQGTLALQSNYWNFISDPELSESWNSRCNAEVDFTNFSPTQIADAGPRKEQVKEVIFDQGWQQTIQQGDGG